MLTIMLLTPGFNRTSFWGWSMALEDIYSDILLKFPYAKIVNPFKLSPFSSTNAFFTFIVTFTSSEALFCRSILRAFNSPITISLGESMFKMLMSEGIKYQNSTPDSNSIAIIAPVIILFFILLTPQFISQSNLIGQSILLLNHQSPLFKISQHP